MSTIPAPKLSNRLRGRKLLHIGLLSQEELNEVIALGEWFRDHPDDRTYLELLHGRLQVLLFAFESTRTRIGFEAAMAQLGGFTTYLTIKETQMGRGESARDTGQVIAQFADIFVARLHSQKDLEIMAESMACPVLSASTPEDHATQVIGELMTIRQAKGKLEGLNLVYTGLARGIFHSLVRICPIMGINLTLAIPEPYMRTVNKYVLAESQAKAKKAGTKLEICNDLRKAVENADFIQASTLIRSMLTGEQLPEEREVEVSKWTVTEKVLAVAKPDVLYSHSGPIYRNICATDAVLDGPKSLIREEARNAFFAKKALLALLVK